jgi:hypothetical protein
MQNLNERFAEEDKGFALKGSLTILNMREERGSREDSGNA